MGWLYEALRECRNLLKYASPEIPALAFFGDNDADVDQKAIQKRMETWSGGDYHFVAGAKHDILSERLEIRKPLEVSITKFFIG